MFLMYSPGSKIHHHISIKVSFIKRIPFLNERSFVRNNSTDIESDNNLIMVSTPLDGHIDLLIANEQPHIFTRLRGGSLIEPCAIVPGAEKISNRWSIE